MQKNYYIVGNKIKNQLHMANVITYDEFINLLANNSGINNIEFSLGQGLSKQQINSIALIVRTLHGSNYTFSDSCRIGAQFSNQLVHKSIAKNTMISIPENLSENFYKSYLLIDEECAEMSDHVTGFHIQGMVLIEAARQMVNAVSEKFLVKQNTCNYFILNGIDAKFNQYIFPIEVEVLHRIIDIRHGLNGAYSATSQIDFMQNGILGMTVQIKHQAMDSVVMDSYESRLALSAIEKGFFKRATA